MGHHVRVTPEKTAEEDGAGADVAGDIRMAVDAGTNADEVRGTPIRALQPEGQRDWTPTAVAHRARAYWRERDSLVAAFESSPKGARDSNIGPTPVSGTGRCWF